MTSVTSPSSPAPDSGARAAGNETVIAGQKRALELAVHGAPLEEILAVLVQTVEDQSSSDVVASILLLDPEAMRLRCGAAPSLPAEYNKAIDGLVIGPDVGSCGTAAFTGKTVVVQDIQTDPLWRNFKALAGKHGLRACWSTPILSTNGDVLGTFALYHHVVATPTERDREIVELLGRTAGLVLERDRESRRRARAETALRVATEHQLARTAAMFQHAPAAIAVLRGPEHVFESTNPLYLQLVGHRAVVGKPVRAALPEVEGQGLFELLDEVRRTGKPFVGRSRPVEVVRTPGGPREESYFDFVYQPIAGPDGAADSILAVAFDVTSLVRARQQAEALARESRAQSGETEKMLLDLRRELEEARAEIARLGATS